MDNQDLTYLLVVSVTFLFILVICLQVNKPPSFTIPTYTYIVVNKYPHDSNAFTQGLAINNGVLYESTGLYGDSTLHSAELETGKTIRTHVLPNQFFGEGITIFNDRIIQLTWLSNKGFVYDKTSFNLIQEFYYPTEGWGITHNSTHLIMSDGTATLFFLDPETFDEVGSIEVYADAPVFYLNELEYIKGEIYANIWQQDLIARINPQTGRVSGWIDLSGIQDYEIREENSILNGIAYDANKDRLFVTGKRWSILYEIKIVPP